jgi:hypothetical protein
MRVDGRTLEANEFLDLLSAKKAQRFSRGSRVGACMFFSVSGVWSGLQPLGSTFMARLYGGLSGLPGTLRLDHSR